MSYAEQSPDYLAYAMAKACRRRDRSEFDRLCGLPGRFDKSKADEAWEWGLSYFGKKENVNAKSA